MMKQSKKWYMFVAAILLLLITGCGILGGGETVLPTETPTRPAPDESPCGDGVCDEVEQANPDLCPEDCATVTLPPRAFVVLEDSCGDGTCDEQEQQDPALCPQDCQDPPPEEPPSGGEETPTPTPTPLAVPEPGEIACAEEDWLLKVNGCADYHGAKNEPNAHICSSFDVCLTVDAQCTIQGSAQGQYDQDTCLYTSPTGCMAYEVSCPDFPISVSGELVTNTLRIRLDASQIWEQATSQEICITQASMSYASPLMQGGYGSALRNGGGPFCEIEARDGAHVEVTGIDAAVPEYLSYSFSVDLYEDCDTN